MFWPLRGERERNCETHALAFVPAAATATFPPLPTARRTLSSSARPRSLGRAASRLASATSSTRRRTAPLPAARSPLSALRSSVPSRSTGSTHAARPLHPRHFCITRMSRCGQIFSCVREAAGSFLSPILVRRRAENINKDLKLAVACKADAAKFCTVANVFPEPGAVLTCLRRARVMSSLVPTCMRSRFAPTKALAAVGADGRLWTGASVMARCARFTSRGVLAFGRDRFGVCGCCDHRILRHR